MKIKTTIFIVCVVMCFHITVWAGEPEKNNIQLNESFVMRGWEYNRVVLWRFTEEEKDILTRLMMAEAGGEGDIGELYVLHVVLNRIKSPEFPDTVKEVVFQNKNGVYQFSSVCDGRIWEVEPDEVCFEIISDTESEYEDYVNGALYFCEKKQ